MSPSKYYISVLLTLIVLLCWGSTTVVHAETDQREYKLKAAFLLNFSKFTTWPEDAFESPDQSFVFCVVGKDPFGSILEGLKTKHVGGRKIDVQYLKSIAEVQPQSCHVLFVSKSEQGKLEKLIKNSTGLPLVTVSDIKGFSKQGGMFEFINRSGRLSFIVNNGQVKEGGLRVNASLLNLAAKVL